MPCKGICQRQKVVKVYGTPRYANGEKRCNQCEVFLKIENVFCPCCNIRLRTHPKNPKNRKELQARNDVRRI